MPRRKGPVDRPAQRESLVTAAIDLVAQEGLDSLTARRLAKAIGYSLGHIYNIFPDLSALTLAVNERTLEALRKTLSEAQGIHAIAAAYLRFASDNANPLEPRPHPPHAGTDSAGELRRTNFQSP